MVFKLRLFLMICTKFFIIIQNCIAYFYHGVANMWYNISYYVVNTQILHCILNAQIKSLINNEINTNSISKNNDFETRIPLNFRARFKVE